MQPLPDPRGDLLAFRGVLLGGVDSFQPYALGQADTEAEVKVHVAGVAVDETKDCRRVGVHSSPPVAW
ncbi:hypothetical protein BGM19_03565 [Streptomyces agglomeratus]|uniref:hypothetical protein n=1 Tax=Streptomyces agglomeratus TaxID=285458 RepID=UPI000852738F|nr:hypothetical protein [Streptomyces agglomeratus]OEJ57195.1 hypothetical protein BGM19_03565 [Streptomyces agglomeratus]